MAPFFRRFLGCFTLFLLMNGPFDTGTKAHGQAPPLAQQRESARPFSTPSPLALSAQLLTQSQKKEPTSALLDQLNQLSPLALRQDLSSDSLKLVFWINLYNAFTRTALLAQPQDYQKRGRFFSRRQFWVAGQRLSLNDIEHGILRKNQYQYGLGYVPQIFPRRFNKEQALQKQDYRIHFALNCGARSCPPVWAYQVDQLDQQLDAAMRNYLQTESYRDSARNTVYVPKLLFWYKGDFGGKKGIRNLLQKNAVPCLPGDRIRFKDYDWTLQL